MLQKQDEKTAAILQKQDDKIDKLAEHTNQNSRMLAHIGETLEKHFTGKPAQQRGNMGDERGANSQGDAAKTGRNPSDPAEEQDNEGDDEADVAYAFSYAKKKRVPRSGEIKRRPVEELRSKVHTAISCDNPYSLLNVGIDPHVARQNNERSRSIKKYGHSTGSRRICQSIQEEPAFTSMYNGKLSILDSGGS